MARFNLEDYEDVKDRLAKFWSENPDGAIHTQLVSDPNIFGKVVFRAEAYKQKPVDGVVWFPDATGFAAEEQGQGGMANTTSWHENAETSAIGRALANMGYATTKNRPSRQEMEKVQRVESQPTRVDFANLPPVSEQATYRPPQPASNGDAPRAIKPGNEDLPASEKQIGFLGSLADERGIDLHEWCPENTGMAFSELTREGASYAIEAILKLPKQGR